MDEHLCLVPVGVGGDLYIAGLGVARGYLKAASMTAECFLPHPFSVQEGARLYKTGDRVRYRGNGTLEFLGRRDQQVKVRGYRIELAEIEAVLSRHPAVRQSVVLLRQDALRDPRLVAYVVSRQPDGSLMGSQLRSYLQEQLPDYMVPWQVVVLETLPLLPNGKVDRRALPSPEAYNTGLERIIEEARTPVEELLVQIWCEVLGDEQVGIQDNFFDLGGHSLLATQIIARVQAELQVQVPLQSLFENPTIAELARRVEQALGGERGVEVASLVPASRRRELPLSFAQRRLWFLDQLEPESIAYLIASAQRLHGALDMAVLECSIEELVRRHESLRTTFQLYEDQPVQVIHSAGVFHLPLLDLRGLEQDERVYEARRLAGQEARQPCDLARGPLLRIYLLWLDAEEYVFLSTMHHVITDGWSNDVFGRELTTLYRAFAAGKPSPLPPLPIQYADFAVWQRQWLQGEVLETQLAYWRRQLAEVPPLELPTDHHRPPVQTFHGGTQSVRLPVALYEELIKLSQQEDVTLFMLLLAAFQVLLARYTGQTDISVGTAIANRLRPELEGLIGFFINTLVLRTDLSGNPSFVDLLRRVREVALGAYTHQDVPFEHLVEVLQPERDLSRSPLFQVSFGVQQMSNSVETPE